MIESITLAIRDRYATRTSGWRISRLWMPDGGSIVRLGLLRILRVAHHERLPLDRLIHTFANEHRGLTRMRLRRFARRLESGTPLVAALEQSPGVLSDEDVLTFRFATQLGLLNDAFDELLQQKLSVPKEPIMRLRQTLLYAFVLTVAVFLVVLFLTFLIAPTFISIYETFGLRLPSTLEVFIVGFHWSIRSLPLLIAAVVLGMSMFWFVRGFRLYSKSITSRLVPPLARLNRSQVLQLLGLAAAGGRPLTGSLSTLARYHHDSDLRLKLLLARNDVEQGADPWQSLADHHLLTNAEREALKSSSTTEFQSWLLGRFAQQQRQLVQQQFSLATIVAHPLLVVGFGVFVLWVTSSYLMVLISLIVSLS